MSRIVVLQDGEAFCIQKQSSAHGSGFILAHAGQDEFSFVEYHNASGEIPTDFSIGDGSLIEAPKVSSRYLKHIGDLRRSCCIHARTYTLPATF